MDGAAWYLVEVQTTLSLSPPCYPAHTRSALLPPHSQGQQYLQHHSYETIYDVPKMWPKERLTKERPRRVTRTGVIERAIHAFERGGLIDGYRRRAVLVLECDGWVFDGSTEESESRSSASVDNAGPNDGAEFQDNGLKGCRAGGLTTRSRIARTSLWRGAWGQD